MTVEARGGDKKAGMDRTIADDVPLIRGHRSVEMPFRDRDGRDYQLVIHYDSFETLALTMIKADPNAAIRAFGAALQAWAHSN
jgi:hypothetical protein